MARHIDRDRDVKKRRLSLLLSDFSPNELIAVCKKQTGEKCNRTTVERWINGESIPRMDHAFFIKNDVFNYLDGLFTQDETIDKALEILNDKFNKPVDRNILEARYKKLFENNDKQYASLLTMKQTDRPYYQDRFNPAFLETHLKMLEQHLGAKAADLIRKRLLRIKTPNGERIFPALDLLPGGITPKLNRMLVEHRSLIKVPDAFIDVVRKTNPRITPNPTFALDSLNLESGEMHCYISNYFHALFQCDKHFYQIAANFPGLDVGFDAYSKNEHIRDWAHHLNDILVKNDFSGIECSIGCSCLVIHNSDDQGYEALVCKKSTDANGMDDMHVIPALMFQPIGNDEDEYARELNIKYQVYREMAEEIFGRPEFDASVHPNHLYTRILDLPEIKDLEALMKAGSAEFHVTGLYLDLFRLRPELLTTIIIHDPQWYKTQMTSSRTLGNWEVANGVLAKHADDESFNKVMSSQKQYLCAPGAAAYVKGYEKFREVMVARNSV
jgi:hypothetical protein